MSSIRHRGIALAVALACLFGAGGVVPPGAAANPPERDGLPVRPSGFPVRPAAAPNPMVVTTLADVVADDGACSLREAITAATTNTAGPDTTGRCRAGSANYGDVIEFNVGGTIVLTADLPEVDNGWLTLEGETAPSPVTIDGANLWHPFTITSEGALDLYGLTITNGTTTGAGGAILNQGMLFGWNCTVSGNQADAAGGGISATVGSYTVLDSCVVADNQTDGYGGGLRLADFAEIRGTLVAGNTAGAGGGGIETVSSGDPDYYPWGLDLAQSAVVNNSATGPTATGGGIHSIGTALVVNVTLAGNTAAKGGGVGDTGSIELYNVTVTGNAAGDGSGLWSSASPILANTIVLGNTGAGLPVSATLDAASTSNLLEVPAGLDLADILAGPLADNGGLTPTVELTRDDGNPAWNGGDAVLCEDYTIWSDQRGYDRSVPCDIGAYEIDDVAPFLSEPTPFVGWGWPMSGTAVAGQVGWFAYDASSDTVTSELEVSVNGAAYLPVTLEPDAQWAEYDFDNGKSYRFRVRATDLLGNVSDWAEGARVTTKVVQQTAGSVDYSSGWKTDSKSSYSGGSVKFTKTKGAWVKFTATGRSFAFVSTGASSRGKVKIYVNGTLQETIDLGGPTTYRLQAWSRTWSTAKSRTIKIVVLGTSGRPRVDADAFIVLQ